MKTKYFRGMIDDQLWPNCGCGFRTIEAEVGRKWGRAREAVSWPTNRKRISRKVWDSMCNQKNLPLIERDKPKYMKGK